MNDGWIKLHRSIMDHPLYHAEPFTRLQAWVDLLLMANIDRRVMLVRGVRIEVERGQVVRSKDYLAGRWRWSRSKVKRYLKLLEDEDMIVQQNTSLISKITVVNYDKFQVDERNLTHPTTHPTTQQLTQTVNQVKTYGKSCESEEIVKAMEINEPTEEPTAEHTDGLTAEQADDLQNKNNRIVEREKKYIYSPNNSARTRTREGEEEFEAPKVEEVEAYAQEKELKMDAAAFVDYYEARGWMVSNGPMKSWRAAARMWARKFAELKREKYLERKAREKAEAEREAERKRKEAEREAERQRKEAEREARYKRQDEEREAARQRKEAEREAERKRKEAEREAARQQQEAARLAAQEARAAQRKAERLARKQRRAAATASTDGAIGISNGAIENPNGAIENPNGAIGINQEFTHPNTTDYVSTHAYPHRSERAAEREREKAQRDAEFQAFIARQLASNEV